MKFDNKLKLNTTIIAQSFNHFSVIRDRATAIHEGTLKAAGDNF